MSARARLSLAVGPFLLCAACGRAPEHAAPVSPPASPTSRHSGPRWGEFPALPDARRLCSGHDVGAPPSGAHVEWTLYATARGPDEVRKFYAGLSGRDPFDEAKAIVQVRRGTAVLTAHPASDRGYPRCGVDPAPSDRTVLVVSVLSQPGP